MKKKLSIFIFLIVILISVFYGLKQILIPHLISTAFNLTDLIHEKENKKDCTCWSTVRLMEFHQSELPINYEASVIKIESMKALISEIWKDSSRKKTTFNDELNRILLNNFPNWQKKIDHLPNEITKETLAKIQKYHYHQLTEHYRYILSIIYDLSFYNHSKSQYAELTKTEINQLALVSTHLNERLLEEAKKSALANKHNMIELIDIQTAFNILLKKLNLTNQPTETGQKSLLFNFWLKRISNKIIDNKIKSLKNYNASLWKSKDKIKTQSYLLSKIFDYDIKEDSLKSLSNGFIENNITLFYSSNFQRIDTHMLNKFSNKETTSVDLSFEIQPFRQVYEKLLNHLPIHLENNGDIRTILDLEDKNGFYHPSEITVRHYTLDAIRDTIIHWDLIKKTMMTKRTSIIDPFGLELLAERISEYYGVILTKTKESNTSLNEMITDEYLLTNKFSQINLSKSDWTPSEKLTPKHFFNQTLKIDTKFFKKSSKKESFYNGYFSGLSTVDIDNDDDIDILIPADDGIKIAYNDGNNVFDIKKIYENINNRTSSVYAIDLNHDFLLDIIAVTYDGILVFEQSNNTFQQTNKIDLKYAFMLCSNDIDNDGDLDFYVTRINDGHPSLDGRNAYPNKLFKTNTSNILIEFEDKSIESTGYGLACSIIDINNDAKKEILIINDFGRDELFYQTIMGFKNKAKELKFDDAGSGMNLSIIDFNEDEYWDIYITMIDMFNKHISFELPLDKSLIPFTEYVQSTSTFIIGNQLYFGSNKEYTRQTTSIFEPGQKGWGWGASFFDYNNNGLNDIYITNGHFVPPAFKNNARPPESEKNIFMLNKNNKFLYSNSLSEESTEFHNSRSVSSADLNNDGNIDIVLRNYNTVILYENTSNEKTSWIKIKLIGNKKNTFAIGSTIEVTTTEKKQKKIVLAETGYLTQEPYTKHFGLNNNKIESIKVTWPNKSESIIKSPIKSNQHLIIFYDQKAKERYEKTQISERKNKHLSIITNFDNVRI